MKMSTNQKFGYVAGGIFLVLGLVGLLVTGLDNFAAKHTTEELLIFELNPLQNVVHLLVGAVLIVGARSALLSRSVNYAVGLIYLFIGVVGLFVADGSSDLNVLALNQPDNGLHLVFAILALGVAMSERQAVAANV